MSELDKLALEIVNHFRPSIMIDWIDWDNAQELTREMIQERREAFVWVRDKLNQALEVSSERPSQQPAEEAGPAGGRGICGQRGDATEAKSGD